MKGNVWHLGLFGLFLAISCRAESLEEVAEARLLDGIKIIEKDGFKVSPDYSVRIFVSRALGKAALLDVISAADQSPALIRVFTINYIQNRVELSGDVILEDDQFRGLASAAQDERVIKPLRELTEIQAATLQGLDGGIWIISRNDVPNPKTAVVWSPTSFVSVDEAKFLEAFGFGKPDLSHFVEYVKSAFEASGVAIPMR